MHWCCAVFVRRIGERSTPEAETYSSDTPTRIQIRPAFDLNASPSQPERMGSLLRRKTSALGRTWWPISPDTTVRRTLSELTPNGPQNINVTGHSAGILVRPSRFHSRRQVHSICRRNGWASLISTPAELCPDHPTLPSPPPSEEASIFGLFGPLALRGEGDYIHTSFFDTSQNNFRMSFGVVLRF